MKNLFLRVSAIVVLLAVSLSAYAQNTVSGSVKDAAGEPIIGASVFVQGTQNGTITDIDGQYALPNVKTGDVLEFSCIGFTSQVITWNGGPLNVVLQEESTMLEGTVVTALGIKRQARSLGYSTTQVKGDDFVLARDNNIGNALSGKVAGVSVSGNATGSTGSSRVIIRGNASLTGNNQPLYVVDGIPYDNTNQGSAGKWGGADMGDGLNNINADDIESIQVLKGAAASALYGYRGGNGAILITTKSGKKDQPMSIEVNNNFTVNTIYDYRDWQTTFGQGKAGVKPNSATVAQDTETSSWGPVLDGSNAVNFMGQNYAYSYVDNWKNFYRTGLNNATSVAISGSSDKVTYRFGVSNVYERSILPNAGNSQQGINMNTTYQILKNLSLNVTANYTFDRSNGRSNLSDGNGNTNASLLYRANSFDVRWMERENDTADWGTAADGSELIGGTNVYYNNPYWLQYRKTNNQSRNRLTGAITLRWDITDWLYLQGAVQRDGYNLEYKQVQPIGAAADPKGWMTEFSKSFSEMNYNFLLGFNKEFGDFTVGATFGGNYQNNQTTQYTVTDGGRPFIVDGFWSVNNIASANRSPNKSLTRYKVQSFYGTVDLGWRNQLFLNLTGRNDWFSTLSPDSNSYFYPSATLSWVFTDTFDLPEWFNFGKVRAGYASASNGTTPYQNMLLFTTRNYYVGPNADQVPVTQNNGSVYPNPGLRPVKISEFEAGLSLAFLQNRLSIDAAVYRKTTTDDIAQISTSKASGYNSKIDNVGQIQNTGFELMIDAYPVKTANFVWNSTFNISYNRSVVKYLGEGVNLLSIDGAEARAGQVYVYNVVGSPYGEVYGYKYKRNDNGDIIFQDGIPQRTDDLVSLGNGVPKWTGGWNNSFSFKNFSLAFLLDFKLGHVIYSETNRNLASAGLHKMTLEGRTADNPVGAVIGKGVNEDGSVNTTAVDAQTYYGKLVENNIAEAFTYNASFVKLRELSFGYNFPQKMLPVWLKGLNVSLVGRNLFTLLKFTDNIDPESSLNNTNGQGLELNGYPATRNIGFNVNIKF